MTRHGDPVQTFEAAFGLEPTAYQVALLSDQRPTISGVGRPRGRRSVAVVPATTIAGV